MLVKSLQDQARFRAAITYHAGMLAVLWPWCYTATVTQDDAAFFTASQKAAQAMGATTFEQSSQDVITTGEYIDYAYMKHETLAITMEVSEQKTSSGDAVASIADGSRKGSLAYFQAIYQLNSNLLPLERQDYVHRGTSRSTFDCRRRCE